MTNIPFSLPNFLFSIFSFYSSHAMSNIPQHNPNILKICNNKKTALFSGMKTDTLRMDIKTIAFYLQDGVEVLDFAGPMEVFSYAGYKIFTVSKTKDFILSQGILKILPDYDISDSPGADMVVFFGGNSDAFLDKELIRWVNSMKNVKYHFSVCTGAFMLAESGVLDGLKATTFHSSLNSLEERFPKIEVLRDVRFVDNGKVITTAGISAGIDGALHMVAKFQGLSQARRVAYLMEYDSWIPGNGIVVGDNPYLNVRKENDFQEYWGSYQVLNDKNLFIEKGIKGGELTAVVNSKKMPLFYVKKDKFFTGDGKPVLFKRDSIHKIIGYTLNEKGILFRKED
ncbi:DJ-1/PfpI family protein [Daejeonella oryzae]|uniref:DJ-1/PfpI family protein n=1 Tax=Daejeonella oryzae TaxID=1122943 RepID=UPI001C660324|nr:DJ-1/PfpI family protein [Daejeonella oryzae]